MGVYMAKMNIPFLIVIAKKVKAYINMLVFGM